MLILSHDYFNLEFPFKLKENNLEFTAYKNQYLYSKA